jgi:hypothetical protein
MKTHEKEDELTSVIPSVFKCWTISLDSCPEDGIPSSKGFRALCFTLILRTKGVFELSTLSSNLSWGLWIL